MSGRGKLYNSYENVISQKHCKILPIFINKMLKTKSELMNTHVYARTHSSTIL